MPVALSLEPPVAEEPFLRRELGLAWEQVTESELRSQLRRGRVPVIVSEPGPYARVLRDAPSGSAVLVMISDEGYSAERLALVQDSVTSVYRQYAATPASPAEIMAAIRGFVGDARSTSQSGRTALPNARKGRETRARMQSWATCPVRTHSVPLGYTSTFAEAFVARYATDDPTVSLFDVPAPQRERPTSITFRGNRGLAARIVGMERASRWPNSDVGTIDADWSGFAEGDVGGTYVEALSTSRFALCPPGFVNNDSFRYFEALLCGALPVELRVALTHQGIAGARSPRAIVRSSWRAGLSAAATMSEPDRQAATAAARTLVGEILARLRASMAADLEG